MDQFIAAYRQALTRYADFSGRTSVGGFWRFVAVNLVISLVLNLLVGVSSFFLVIGFIYWLALLIPGLAITVRRLHDTGKAWPYILVGLIPFVGWIILIVFCVQASDGPNEFGAGPED